jgi:hypothetical protein
MILHDTIDIQKREDANWWGNAPQVLILFKKLSIIFLPVKGHNLTTRFTIKDE